MESEEKILEKKEKIKNWLKDPYNQISVFLGIAVIFVYLYYFFKLGNQPIWWDEGDYLAIAKVWGLNQPIPEWWEHFILMRPLFIPFIWSLFFKIGLGETAIRFFTLLIPSILTCYLVYRISEYLFNKKIAIISTSIFSFNWVWVFYSFRLLTDIPSTFFGTLAIFFFLIYYEGKQKNFGLYFAVFFGILSFLARYTGALILISIATYMLITERMSLFRKKQFYIAIILGLLFLSPFFLFNQSHFGNIFPALGFYHGSNPTVKQSPFGWNVLTFHLPLLLNNFLIIFFIIGFILILQLFFYIDLIFLQKNKSRNHLLFIFLNLLIPVSYFIFGIKNIDARYLLILFPTISVTSAYGVNYLLTKLSSFFNKKTSTLLFIILFIVILSFFQIKSSNNFIDAKFGSYQELKDAGLWLKQSTPKDAKIITASIVQMQYYSERSCYDFYVRNETDPNGVHNKTLFDKKIQKIKPHYFIIHGFEPAFTPQWAYTYPQQHNLTFVKAFYRNGQPTLIIYKFNN